jgi:hypothetical protein
MGKYINLSIADISRSMDFLILHNMESKSRKQNQSGVSYVLGERHLFPKGWSLIQSDFAYKWSGHHKINLSKLLYNRMLQSFKKIKII